MSWLLGPYRSTLQSHPIAKKRVRGPQLLPLAFQLPQLTAQTPQGTQWQRALEVGDAQPTHRWFLPKNGSSHATVLGKQAHLN